jgi:hypothetical protein
VSKFEVLLGRPAFRLDPGAAIDAAAAFTTITLGANSAFCPATSHQAGSRELSERLKT